MYKFHIFYVLDRGIGKIFLHYFTFKIQISFLDKKNNLNCFDSLTSALFCNTKYKYNHINQLFMTGHKKYLICF